MKPPVPPRRIPEDAVTAVRARGQQLAAAVKRRGPVEAEKDEEEKPVETPGKDGER